MFPSQIVAKILANSGRWNPLPNIWLTNFGRAGAGTTQTHPRTETMVPKDNIQEMEQRKTFFRWPASGSLLDFPLAVNHVSFSTFVAKPKEAYRT